MRKKRSMTYHLLTAAAIVMATSMPSQAQSWLDYAQTVARYPLLQSSNAATLTTYSPSDSSQLLLGDATLTMGTAQGHLARPGASPHAWEAQARVQSIYRMSRRVVVRGMMDYHYGWGSQAGGSVWIDPEQMPFDITETTDSTRGKTSLESYRLMGEVGVGLGHGVSLGGCFDYTTASGAKRKDPRHTVSLMHCLASVGATWHGGGFTIGGNYLFGRTTQALKFSTVGRTDQIYHYLVNHGAYYGREETTDGNGYVGSANERPWLDIKHGLAMLAGYHHTTWDWVIEGQWTHRHGHYGLESPSMIDFNRHKGDEWSVSTWWQHLSGSDLQRVKVYYHRQDVKDNERTYRIITTGGVTDVAYYDDRHVGDARKSTLGVSGEVQWGVTRQLATWRLQAALQHSRRSITASLYPYYRQQQSHFTELAVTGERNWLTRADHTWSLALTAGWGDGGGTAAHDGVYQTPSDDATAPRQHMLYLMRQYEYLTASRLLTGLEARWSIPVNSHRMRLYLDCTYRYSQAFSVHYLEDGHRHQGALSIGCLF